MSRSRQISEMETDKRAEDTRARNLIRDFLDGDDVRNLATQPWFEAMLGHEIQRRRSYPPAMYPEMYK